MTETSTQDPAGASTSASFLEPLAGDDPAGSDPRLEPEFDEIQAELAKISSAESLPVNWVIVERLAGQILRDKAKDLRCLAYWVVAVLRTDPKGGLLRALTAFSDVVAKFGPAMHPRRAKSRTAAIVWLVEHFEAALRHRAFALESGDLSIVRGLLDRCYKLLSELEFELASWHMLSGAVTRHVKLIASPGEQKEALKQQFPTHFADIGVSMLEAAGLDAPGALEVTGFRMRRWALWMVMPVPNDQNQLDVDLPDDIDTLLLAAANSGRWTEVLEEAEKIFVVHPFSLDVSRWITRAAHKAHGEELHRALLGELRGLLTRAPGLLTARDRKNRSLASTSTREWIEADVIPEQPRGEGDSASLTLPTKLRELLESGDVQASLKDANAWIAGAFGRTRFARSVALASAFRDMGATEQSFVVFRGLHNYLRSMSLREWDPNLFAACLEGYLDAKRRGPGLDGSDEPLLDELSLLNPSAIMQILR